MRFLKIFLALLLLVLPFISLNVAKSYAVEPVVGSWTLVGMSGYEIHSFAADPNEPDTLYVGTSNYGIFKSTNGGSSWVAINNGIANFAEGYITDIVIDPNNSNILYAGGFIPSNGTSLFKSIDGGNTWTITNNGIVDVGFGGPPPYVHNIIIDKEDSNIVYAALGNACGSVYKTENGGNLWTRGIGLPCDPEAVRQDLSNPDILYAGNGAGIFRSHDRGVTWQQVSSTGSTGGLSINPSITSTLFSSNFSGIFKSTDSGNTWSLVNQDYTQVYKALLNDPVRLNTLYAGQDRGVATGAYVSTNGGTTWESMNAGLPAVGVKRLLIPKYETNKLYAGTENGVYVYGLFLNTNHPPVLESIGNQSVNEGQLLEFTVNASDPDGDNLIYAVENLPAGATFNPTTHVFSWTPNFNQAGNFENVEFTVTDDGSPMELDVESITITVGGVNRAPEFTPVAPKEVLENVQLSFTVSATDPDDDTVTLSAANVPTGASFNPNTGVFSWTPTLSQAGNYVVTFHASDNGSPVETGQIEVVITVGDDPTPAEQADNLVTSVINYDFPTHIENSYIANLKKVTIFIQDGKVQAAINQLNAFKTKVQEDYTAGDISLTERNALIALANALLADLQ